tara:strand:- start:1287 stop:1793 length:507 start_codon:yes stop_codon:yes gene_type:complete
VSYQKQVKNKFINIFKSNYFDCSLYDFALVLSQLIIIILHFIKISIFNFYYLGEIPVTFQNLGKLLIIFGIIFLIFSIKELGNNLSPFPRPKKDGKFISKGIYKIFKHPMYYSLMIFSLGLFLINLSIYNFILSIALSIILFLKIKQEEKYLKNKFPDYLKYKNRLNL